MSVDVTPRPAMCAPLPRWPAGAPRDAPRAAGGMARAGERPRWHCALASLFPRAACVGHASHTQRSQHTGRVRRLQRVFGFELLTALALHTSLAHHARMALGDESSLAAPATGLLPFLESLPPAAVEAVYASRWTCAALVRALPPLAKHMVMRLVHVDTAVPVGAYVQEAPSVETTQSRADSSALLFHHSLSPPGGS